MRNKWIKTEDDYLIANYPNKTKGELINYLDRTWLSIQSRASKLGIKRINIEINGRKADIWTDEQINYLKNNYKDENKNFIISYLNRTWSSIQNKAFLLDLKRCVENANVMLA